MIYCGCRVTISHHPCQSFLVKYDPTQLPPRVQLRLTQQLYFFSFFGITDCFDVVSRLNKVQFGRLESEGAAVEERSAEGDELLEGDGGSDLILHQIKAEPLPMPIMDENQRMR